MKKCAILTMDCLDDFEAYDELIIAPLAALGWQASMVSWRNKQVDWNNYHAVIIRSPWDYQDDAPAFLDVLKAIEASSAQLENTLATVAWNIDKAYLKALEQQGVIIVPTRWPENFNEQTLAAYFNEFNVEQLVLKPRISANADNTFWLKKSQYQNQLAELNHTFAKTPFMAQPFIESVINEGEFSLFYFNGQYSHAILKTPKADDFRVQEEHGGSLKTIEPEAELVTCANKALAAIEQVNGIPLYARVDFVRFNNTFALMEAELIEPSLYFNMDPQSPQRFANAFATRMEQKNA